MKKIEAIIEELRKFVAERNWGQFHDPKNLTMLLSSEVGELTAELRWLSNSESDSELKEGDRRNRVEEEIGDVFISLLLLSDRLNIDLIQAAEKKLLKNRSKYPTSLSYGKSEIQPTEESDAKV